MTEPTAEQIEAERERAHAVLDLLHMWCEPTVDDAPHDLDCTLIATALARVRIEAHAAGRDEVVTGLAPVLKEIEWQATLVPRGSGIHDYWIGLADAIRALRGRT